MSALGVIAKNAFATLNNLLNKPHLMVSTRAYGTWNKTGCLFLLTGTLNPKFCNNIDESVLPHKTFRKNMMSDCMRRVDTDVML